jgi:hypothetical protein
MILSFSVVAIIAKINTKMKIKVVNNIPNNRPKFICAININVNPLHIEVTSADNRKIDKMRPHSMN